MMYKHIYFVIATSAPVSLYSHATSIIKFNGFNFSDWCEQIRFHLGVLDLDLALLSEKPVAITSASSDEDRSFYKAWERSNRLSLMFMRMTVAKNIKSTIKNTEDAKEFMKSVEKCSQSESADKSLAGTLMSTLTNIKFDGSRTIHEHILEMTNLAARLKTMGMEVNENFWYQSNPGMDHWKAAKKIQILPDVWIQENPLLAIIAASTIEAEFVACFEATVHGLWLRNFISGLGIVDSIAKLLRIYCDNSATVFFSKNDKYSKGAKHMELKYFAVKEEVQKQRVSIKHINTKLMIADPLTKGLPPKTFNDHVEHMGISRYHH
ncbi:UBN2_2 domain-containing protein [Cucumis melo var. makuwa]|uniref:UBN2_2 domain-containing protein n=2 Tax=Cucumis melo var. makuwa TaxID=1194695 RepID=A0A5A7TDB8_CUCMM|nr:UBN2_2 domain-containing protein [Cucumis melo var. makuwa]